MRSLDALVWRNLTAHPLRSILTTLAMGVLFGPLGLLFGCPLAIVADVWVRKLYV